MLPCLLLNATYEPISFRSGRSALKLLAKEKVDVIASWDEKISWGMNGKNSVFQPAILKLKYRVAWIPRKRRFNPTGVFRRDHYLCQYCGDALTPSQLTLDHVIPQSLGGEDTWKNCVTACFACNNYKGQRTPAQANMVLLSQPKIPFASLADDYFLYKRKHEAWADYLRLPSAS